EAGLLGMIEPDDTIQYYRKPLRLHTVNSEFSNLNITNLPEVAIVYSYAGAKGDLINSIIDTKNYQGIVIAGTGAGLMSTDEKAALLKAQKSEMFIVRSSRGGSGRVTETTNFANSNFIAGDNLSPQKARILLMTALLKHHNVSDIQKIFYAYYIKSVEFILNEFDAFVIYFFIVPFSASASCQENASDKMCGVCPPNSFALSK